MTDQDPIPFFMPSLAVVLANAEHGKGSALSENEVLALRDGAICIMTERGDALKIATSRGYDDVDPEDCWADWHRLHAEFTGGYRPRIILCSVGDSRFAEQAEPLVRAAGCECEVGSRDPQMQDSFDIAGRGQLENDLVEIGEHTRVVYVLSPPLSARDAGGWALKLLKLAGQLIHQCGAVGVKCESSGIAHSRERWDWLVAQADSAVHPVLVDAFVTPLIGEGGELWSCGMHLLGRPDFIARSADLPPDLHDLNELQNLFLTLGGYLVAECSPERPFRSGSTFQSSPETPRVRAVFEVCDGYDEDDYFFNPFGRFRISSY